MVQLGSNGRPESLSEVAYQGGLIGSTSGVELFQHSLQMLQVCGPIWDFLLLVLGVSSDLYPVTIHKGPGVS